ncbi:chemotaxis protein CheD [Sphingomonas sp. PP-CC-3G-468]|uniref:chemotaxis protein CheD n=1 Tax=Sphingomonas sp. PP-CC-3G-468 TaxID=2135656 RepID=UPI00104B43C8|nr:chemotaxis protein CheD [Sphingomonas sp. PP-CC-3G-468]TCM00506.1 chemotaxis protein CheD [Sphingomonas sp. PP-CC-3G-468]
MTSIPREPFRRITVMQGETRVSDDPEVVMTTILGSCISACFFDPFAKVGGLNHFLLAEPGHGGTDAASMQRYGVYAMEVLINAMLALGAARASLRARIYGGASMHDGLRDIGAANAAFARRFLKDERIMLVGEDVGGHDAKRVEFRPTLGLARCRTAAERTIVAYRPRMPSSPVSTGDVEFF